MMVVDEAPHRDDRRPGSRDTLHERAQNGALCSEECGAKPIQEAAHQKKTTGNNPQGLTGRSLRINDYAEPCDLLWVSQGFIDIQERADWVLYGHGVETGPA